ncbi:MAG: HEAT repeat domain-containing protein [Planctomycetaceae bacterium]|nr:HEAT repeat domain-containing protein [Planctomycetaceae bacterium]
MFSRLRTAVASLRSCAAGLLVAWLLTSSAGTHAALPIQETDATPIGVRLATFDIDATPEVGMMMAYDPVRRVDELGLRCRGMVLLGIDEPIVLCAIDWIGIGNEGHDLFREVLAQAAGTTPARVAVHALHQHDAPRFDASAERLLIEAGVSDLGFYQSALAREVLQRLSVAVQRSLTTAVPISEFGYGVADVREVASNRRILGPDGKVRATRFTATRDPAIRAEPEGVIDPQLTSLAFYNGADPVAILTYYACHPQSYYRTGVPSPDFPGIARFMHGQDVPSALHVHFNGAGGNLGAGKYNDGSPENRLRLAERMADGMRAALKNQNRMPLTPDLVDWKVEPVHLPVADHLDPAAMRKSLAQWKRTDFFGSPDRLAFWLRAQSGQPIELSCLKIGPVRVLHMPGELFVEYQLAAKALRPDLTVAMAAYGDYATGYIGTAIAYEQGGYETEPRSSNVGPGVEAVLMDGIKKLLVDEHAAPNYQSQLPRIKPREPDQALLSFETTDGFAMQLTAAEPMVTSPVAMQWDEQGDLFVCEMRGYSEHRDDRLSRIVRLRDLNDDGIFDDSVVFADQLYWPTALFPSNGGLFVVDAPQVWFFRDQDGDGRQDYRELVLTGLGTGNVQGLANSFRWGLDNRIHLACSSNGGRVYREQDGPEMAFDLQGRDLALDPRTGRWELTTGAAQHGMAFDDWGRKFVCSNSDHLQQIMYEGRYLARNPHVLAAPGRLSIAADGPQAEVFRISPVEPWRILRTRLRVSGVVRGPIEGGGRAAGYFTGATGINIYRGDAYADLSREADLSRDEDLSRDAVLWRDPSGESNLAVVGDVGGNLIHRKRLERQGLAHVGTRIDLQREWVASRDVWFRPAQFENSPDGTLHVIDVYREVIEHPHSLPPEIKQHIDLNSGRDRGRLYRIIPPGFQHRPTPKLRSERSKHLVRLLEHPNAWHRETAARLLYERQDTSVRPELEALVEDSHSALGRMHALYVLAGLDALSPSMVVKGLRDAHPQVRRHAVRLAESFLSGSQMDDNLLAEWLRLVDDPHPEVRYQLAFSLGSLSGENRTTAVPALVKLARQDIDQPWMQTALQSSATGLAGELLLTSLRDHRDVEWPSTWLSSLVRQMLAESPREQWATLLQEFQTVFRLSQQPQQLVVVKPVWDKLLEVQSTNVANEPHFERIDLEVVRSWIATLQRTALSDVATQVTNWRDGVPGSASQLERGFALLEYAEPNAVREQLLDWLNPNQPTDVQLLVIRTLTNIRTPEIAEHYLASWPSLSPRVRQAVVEALFADPSYVDVVLAAIARGTITAREFPKDRWESIAQRGTPEQQSIATEFLSQWTPQDRGDLIARYRTGLVEPTDRENGRRLFREHCAGCHQLEGHGSALGPSLAGLAHKGIDFILNNVLDPNLEVNPQYFNYVVLRDDGRTSTGILVEENATSILLQRADNVRETLLRSEIQELKNTGQSIMPEGLERTLTPAQMSDLLAYLLDVPAADLSVK